MSSLMQFVRKIKWPDSVYQLRFSVYSDEVLSSMDSKDDGIDLGTTVERDMEQKSESQQTLDLKSNL
ncbi:hypothetical protein ANCCAN_29507 [Ancylostoma caninum]|uniref:Uncharacterized protein n=1 Tax=Ancylostoma caninum TaxID=29170 RepID=A0A368EYA8_ANCCA|nr:hypothetical protein ANCCAN_29507 [Ancylostoma caninum]